MKIGKGGVEVPAARCEIHRDENKQDMVRYREAKEPEVTRFERCKVCKQKKQPGLPLCRQCQTDRQRLHLGADDRVLISVEEAQEQKVRDTDAFFLHHHISSKYLK
jgi:hypothetical protein